MLAAGEFVSLRRGLYVRDRTDNPLALAAAIHGPSYVVSSPRSAWHGLIPERVEAILCATLKRPVEFETPMGSISVSACAGAGVFAIGIERVDEAPLPWLLASPPTKALCDTITPVLPPAPAGMSVPGWMTYVSPVRCR